MTKKTYRIDWQSGGFEVIDAANFGDAAKSAAGMAKRNYREIRRLAEIEWPPTPPQPTDSTRTALAVAHNTLAWIESGNSYSLREFYDRMAQIELALSMDTLRARCLAANIRAGQAQEIVP